MREPVRNGGALPPKPWAGASGGPCHPRPLRATPVPGPSRRRKGVGTWMGRHRQRAFFGARATSVGSAFRVRCR